jgi:group I intron endonuclease
MVYGRIYKITNTLNQKEYYGQTRQLPNRRWYQHQHSAKHGGKMILYHAMRLYGVEHFTFEVVCECDTLEELNAKEIEYISMNDSLAPKGYNAGKGGDNYEKTPETRAKLSASNKGRVMSEEWRKNMSIAAKGRTATEETRLKMRKAQKGRIITDETKQKLRDANLGKKQTADTIAKKRAARIGVPWSDKKRESMVGRKASEEQKKKMSNIMKGRVISEEAKQKMRDTKKAQRKITEEQIKEIRDNPENLRQCDFAIKFNVSKQLINNIVHCKGCYALPLVDSVDPARFT